jgi:hypothetical protein
MEKALSSLHVAPNVGISLQISKRPSHSACCYVLRNVLNVMGNAEERPRTRRPTRLSIMQDVVQGSLKTLLAACITLERAW